MSTLPPPLCILVAGVPRSGSTWAFNAARLLLRDAGVTLHAAWVALEELGDSLRKVKDREGNAIKPLMKN